MLVHKGAAAAPEAPNEGVVVCREALRLVWLACGLDRSCWAPSHVWKNLEQNLELVCTCHSLLGGLRHVLAVRATGAGSYPARIGSSPGGDRQGSYLGSKTPHCSGRSSPTCPMHGCSVWSDGLVLTPLLSSFLFPV